MARIKNLSVGICGCLLLPIVSCCFFVSPVSVLLFATSEMPSYSRVAAMLTSEPIIPSLSQPSMPGASRTADEAAITGNQETLPPLADAASGKQSFNTFQPAAGIACSTCHRVDSEERLVGPGLMNVGKRALTRIQGLSGIEYLHQSIVSPSAYVVEGYADLMPKNWGRVFSEKQINDLIAYLLTLRGN